MPRYTKEEVRQELAKRQFILFLKNYVYINDPKQGRLKYDVWPHLAELAEALKEHRLLVWLKARQIGASWTVAAYALWQVLFHKGARVLLFSQGEDEAAKLLGKCKYIYEQLPNSLRPKVESETQKSLIFGNGWYIQAFPSTANAGRGETASLIVYDEADYHEYLDSNYNATKPTIDDVGGQLLLVSTANPLKAMSLFKRTYKEAPDNGFFPLFYAYNVRPNRTMEWYESTKKTYTDPFLFAKEYPRDAYEALAPPTEIQVFQTKVLDDMRTEVRAPIDVVGSGNIYQRVIPGRKYIAATDVAHGVGQDSSVTLVLDVQTGMVVGDLISKYMEESEFAVESVRLLRAFAFPVWAIESNESGRAVIDRAKLLDYPRLYSHKKGETGWLTRSNNRAVLWSDLIQAIHSRSITIPNLKGLEEFYQIIRRPDKEGRIAAEDGGHDDYPMALGIAIAIRDQAQRAETAGEFSPKQTKSIWKWK